MTESLLRGLLAFVGTSTLSGNGMDVSVSLSGDTLDEGVGSLVSHFLNELLLDEDGSVLDGGSSSCCTSSGGSGLRLMSGERLLGDLVGDLSSNVLELSEGLRFSVSSDLVDNDSGGSSSGSLEVLSDFLGSLLSEFLDKLVHNFLHVLLDGNTGSLSGVFLDMLGFLSLLMSRLLDRFLSGMLGNLSEVVKDFPDSLSLSVLGLFDSLADSFSGGDTVGHLHVSESNHPAALGEQDSFLSTERSAVGTGNSNHDGSELGSAEMSSRVSHDRGHSADSSGEGSVGPSDLVSEGKFVTSSGHLGPHVVLPGLAAHSEDVSKSSSVVNSLEMLVHSSVVRMSTCMSFVFTGST